jgi:hypothetical protein
MTRNVGKTHRKLLVRSLAAVALIAVYCLSTMGLVVATGVSPAMARGRGGGRGRGFVGGRGRGFRGGGFGFYGYYGPYDACWWSPRRHRWICPYYYY